MRMEEVGDSGGGGCVTFDGYVLYTLLSCPPLRTNRPH